MDVGAGLPVEGEIKGAISAPQSTTTARTTNVAGHREGAQADVRACLDDKVGETVASVEEEDSTTAAMEAMGLPLSFGGGSSKVAQPSCRNDRSGDTATLNPKLEETKVKAPRIPLYTFVSKSFMLEENGEYKSPWIAALSAIESVPLPKQNYRKGMTSFRNWTRDFRAWRTRVDVDGFVRDCTEKASAEDEARGRNRIRSLEFLLSICRERADLNLYEGTSIVGDIVTVNGAGTEILMKGMYTPMGKYPYARIRLDDTVSIIVPPQEFEYPAVRQQSNGPQHKHQSDVTEFKQALDKDAIGPELVGGDSQELPKCQKNVPKAEENNLDHPLKPDETEMKLDGVLDLGVSPAAIEQSSNQNAPFPQKTKEEKKKNRKKNKRKNKKNKGGLVDGGQRKLLKYWMQRRRLFSKFDEGIKMDHEGWYSVTPEPIAAHVAEKCRCKVLLDPFAGVGGNAIQFAKVCEHVIAIEHDPLRMLCLRENARLYGVEHKMSFILGDFMSLAKGLKADVVFLAPEWGGVDYSKAESFDIATMCKPNGVDIFRTVCKHITTNIAYFLPKNTPLGQIADLAAMTKMSKDGPAPVCEIEGVLLRGMGLRSIMAYYGDLADRIEQNIGVNGELGRDVSDGLAVDHTEDG